jgi:hypothetical protein
MNVRVQLVDAGLRGRDWKRTRGRSGNSVGLEELHTVFKHL